MAPKRYLRAGLVFIGLTLASCSSHSGVYVPAAGSAGGSGSPATSVPIVVASSPPSSTSGESASLVADGATIKAIQAYYASLPQAADTDDATKVAAFMATQSRIRVAGSTDTFAVAQFDDGVFYTLDTFYDSTSNASATPPPAQPAALLGRRSDAEIPNLSQGNVQIAASTAYIFSNPTVFIDSTPEQGIAYALKTSGYTTVSEPITLQNLLSVRDASLLYINSHGFSTGNLPGVYKGEPVQGPAFSLALSDTYVPGTKPVQPYLSLLYAGGSTGAGGYARRNANGVRSPDGIIITKGTSFGTPNELTILTARILDAAGNVLPGIVDVYAVTQTFFAQQKQLTFAPNALVFLNACWSDDYSNFGVRSLISTLASRGVTSYLGFTKSAQYKASNETANFIFDRWLGEQQPLASAAIQSAPAKETPAERPFSLGEILTYGQSYTHASGYNKGLAERIACVPENAKEALPAPGCAILTFVKDKNNGQLLLPQTLLAPSVDTFSIDETQATPALTIRGEFPSEQGRVVVATSPDSPAGGYEAPVQSWSPTSIVAGIPPGGKGSSGYVYVVGNGIASNPVPLTEWLGTIDYTYLPAPFNFDFGPANNQSVSGDLQAKTAITAAFRDDVHKSRPGPGATPLQTGMKLQWATSATTADFSAGGTDSGQLCNGSIGDQPECEAVSDSWSPLTTTIPYAFSTSPYNPTKTQLSLPTTFCNLTGTGPTQLCMTATFGVNPAVDDSGSGGETIGYMSCDTIDLDDSTLLALSYDPTTFAISPGTTASGDVAAPCADFSDAKRRPRTARQRRAAATQTYGGSYDYGFRTLYAPDAKTPG